MTPTDQKLLEIVLNDLRAVRPVLDKLSNRLMCAAAATGQSGMSPDEALALLALSKVAYVIAHEGSEDHD